MTRMVPLDVGHIRTNMVWQTRFDKDQKHAWFREQIRAVNRRL
jgi:hypothetical protein